MYWYDPPMSHHVQLKSLEFAPIHQFIAGYLLILNVISPYQSIFNHIDHSNP